MNKINTSRRAALKLLSMVGATSALTTKNGYSMSTAESDLEINESDLDLLEELIETSTFAAPNGQRAAIDESARYAVIEAYRGKLKWQDLQSSMRPIDFWPRPLYTHTYHPFSSFIDRALLDDTPEQREFTLGIDEIQWLLERNNFVLKDNTRFFVFALRGCECVSDPYLGKSSEFKLRWTLPNGYDMKCVCGVIDLELGCISFYPASTVPHMRYMYTQKAIADDYDASRCNMLLTGMYRYKVGMHGITFQNTHKRIPGALRLQDNPWVLRCDSDALRYDLSIPLVAFVQGGQDNVHPAWTSTNKNYRHGSAGCIVVDGTSRNWAPVGHWKQFRSDLELTDLPEHDSYPGQLTGDEDKQFQLVLLGGYDAYISANKDHKLYSSYQFVRYGSGAATASQQNTTVVETVKALQQKIGTTADGDFRGQSLKRLLETQSGASDGIATGYVQLLN